MPYWVWSLIAVLIFMPILIRVLTFFTVQGLRLRPGWKRTAEESEIPDWEREVIRGADGILAAQGFRFIGYGRQQLMVTGEPDTVSVAYYENGDMPVWGMAYLSPAPLPQCPFRIAYASCFTNGALLATSNMDASVTDEKLPHFEEQIVLAGDWESAWKLHRDRHLEMETRAPAERVPLEALIFLRSKVDADILDHLRGTGALVPAEPGLGKLSLAACWKAAFKLASWHVKANKINQAWLKEDRFFPLPPRAEAESYLRSRKNQPMAGAWAKTLLVLISLVSFSLLWGKGFDLPFMAAFALVLTLHEMGHALMMRWVGYRNVNIFFIPFFGAMATGRVQSLIPAWKEALVLLAGPVPGMLLGIALFRAHLPGRPEFLYQLASLAVFINAFNLLPAAPLDGGKLLDLILFRRAPRLGQIFLVLSALGLIALAAYGRSPFLGFIAAAIVIASRKTYRRAKLIADWNRERETAARAGENPDRTLPSEVDLVTELFRRFQGEKPSVFAQKAAQIKLMLHSVHVQPPGFLVAAGLLAVYLGSWALPVYMMTRLPFTGSSFKHVSRANLKGDEAALYDGLCADSSVVDIRSWRIKRALTLTVRAISVDDTARLKRYVADWKASGSTRLRKKTKVYVTAPLWLLGGLDSTLQRGLVYPGGDEDYDDEDSAKPISDSLQHELDRYHAKVDSLNKVEAALWRAWPAERKRAWLAEWKRERESHHDTLHCWKAGTAAF